MAWEYINSGAADEITLRWNPRSIRPDPLEPARVARHQRLEYQGESAGTGVAIPGNSRSDVAAQNSPHPEGELATARGAGAAGAAMV